MMDIYLNLLMTPEHAEDVVIPDDPLNEDLDTIPTEPGEDTPLNSNETEPGLEPSIPPSVPDYKEQISTR